MPKDEQMSISFYKMINYRNVGKCHPKEYDEERIRKNWTSIGVKVERKALSTIEFESAKVDMGYENEF